MSWKQEALIKKASQICIEAGADFIKTSTGKVSVNATPEYARMMLEVIRVLGVAKTVGFKPAGGVRTAEDAQQYLAMADVILGGDLGQPSLPFRRFKPTDQPSEYIRSDRPNGRSCRLLISIVSGSSARLRAASPLYTTQFLWELGGSYVFISSKAFTSRNYPQKA